MNNLIGAKNIVNNEGVKSLPSLFTGRPGTPQEGAGGFDDIFDEVKKRLSGQPDAAASGNVLPPDALCVIPLGPNINVLTQKNPEFSADTIRQFALGEGLNPDILRMLLGTAAAPAVAPAVNRAGTVQAAAREAIPGVPPAVPGQLFAPGVGGAVPPAAAPAATTDLSPASRPDLTIPVMPVAGRGTGAHPALAVLAPAAPDGSIRAAGAPAAATPVVPQTSVMPNTDAGARAMSRPWAPPAPDAAVGHFSVSFTPAPAATVMPALPPVAMAVFAADALQAGHGVNNAVEEGSTPAPLAAPGAHPLLPLDAAADVQAAPAAAQAVAAKMNEGTLVTQALAEAALKAGWAERRALAGGGGGAYPEAAAGVKRAAGVASPQALTAGAVWHEEIDLTGWMPTQTGVHVTAAEARAGGQPGMHDHSAENNAVLQDKLYQQQQYQKLSGQMMDVVGRRIADQVARGVWQMSFQLRPARLGRIDVQLGMSDGAVDATFSASQAGTQQLLDGGLARLKGALESAGMQVGRLATDANAPRDGGRQGQAGGEPGGRAAPRASHAPLAAVPRVTAAGSRWSADGVDLFV